MALIGLFIFWILRICIWLLIARMIISWIPLFAPRWRPPSPLAALFELVYTITDPPLKALGRVIPPLNLGTISLDLGFMVLFLLLVLLQRVTLSFFF